MYYGNIKNYDIADGLGVRVSLFVSGCRNHCKECFNQMTWDFCYGKEFTEETVQEILELMKSDFIDGFSLLGGEPFEEENQKECTNLLRRIKETVPEKNIWCWSGYILDKDILPEDGRKHTEFTNEMLSYIDVLIDGPFMITKKNLMLDFCGSENQRVIDLKETLKTGEITLFKAK